MLDLLLFKYYGLFHDFLGYYIYLLLFPTIFTLVLIFFYREIKVKKVKSKIPGATEISPSCSAAVYRMEREEITQNAI